MTLAESERRRTRDEPSATSRVRPRAKFSSRQECVCSTELFSDSAAKAASNIPAASSSASATPKAPPMYPDTQIPETTLLATQNTSSTSNASEYGGPKKKEAEQITVDKWPLPTEFRSWKITFKREACHSFFAISQSRDVMDWRNSRRQKHQIIGNVSFHHWQTYARFRES